MKQVIQTFKDSKLEVRDVPVPSLTSNSVLVRTRTSVISAGTERSKIDMGKKNLVEKALARPDLVKQVIHKLKAEGVNKTFQTVKARMESPNALGYSLSGEVIAVGGNVPGIAPGDKVACAGGGYAVHAEFVSVPKNLVAKIPHDVDSEEAAFATLGAIALQGVRLAQPQIGETFLVLGLGLIGQLVAQILLANGCRVIGTDIDVGQVRFAEKYGIKGVHSSDNIATACKELTAGKGVDGVLICAATSDNGPIDVSGEVTRDKGRIVVVGAVKMDIPREPYFSKEISVVISRSYGPGRYDPSYEESGHDYPYGYVRFTEQRNMETFLNLVAEKKVDVASLITHRFPLDQAPQAYDLIEGEKSEPYLGIVLEYEESADIDKAVILQEHSSRKVEGDSPGISLCGAGNYTTATLLPLLKDMPKIVLRGVQTSSGRTAQDVASRFDFEFCTDQFDELLGKHSDALIIATRHNTHASLTAEALRVGKHVYVEKPLALTIEELSDVHQAFQQSRGAQLMTGYNRRYAPLTLKLTDFFSTFHGPLSVNIRVNAGVIPGDHWTQDSEIGGGRVIGEGCHFVDLASAICGSLPRRVYAIGARKPDQSSILNDNVSIALTMENGSIAHILYTADGSRAMAKEVIEVMGGGKSAVLNDFRELSLYEGDKAVKRHRSPSQDKGQRSMLNAWIAGLTSGEPCMDYEGQISIAMTTIMAVESMMIGQPVSVDLSILEA